MEQNDLKNALEERYEVVDIFGQTVLLGDFKIDRKTVPNGWFCYELCGSYEDPGTPATLKPFAVINHVGTILAPESIWIDKEKGFRELDCEMEFFGEQTTIAEFCEECGFEVPQVQYEAYTPRPARPDEAGLFYAMTPEENGRLGCIGHERMDFGSTTKNFYHTWWERGPEELNTPEFREELTDVINTLRKTVLRDLSAMRSYCARHGGEIGGREVTNYGYVVETERYRYCLRCNPIEGDYQAYLTAFDKQVQQMNQAQETQGSENTMGMEGM